MTASCLTCCPPPLLVRTGHLAKQVDLKLRHSPQPSRGTRTPAVQTNAYEISNGKLRDWDRCPSAAISAYAKSLFSMGLRMALSIVPVRASGRVSIFLLTWASNFRLAFPWQAAK